MRTERVAALQEQPYTYFPEMVGLAILEALTPGA
jgi:hypothetical protein